MSAQFFSRSVFIFGFILLTISLSFLIRSWASTERSEIDRGPAVLTGAEEHSISPEAAQKLISNYRLSTSPGSVNSELFGREAVTRILGQSNCVGLKISYARRDDGTPVLVLSGVDRNGTELRGGELAENGIICPPVCGFESAAVQ